MTAAVIAHRITGAHAVEAHRRLAHGQIVLVP